jgi:predicted metal-dependent hydrolase
MQPPDRFPELHTAVAFFNRGAYREALLIFEQIWHQDRSESLRVLILLSNAMNQLRLGLVTAPRRNLDTAVRLLGENPEALAGIDLAEIHTVIHALRAVIPDDLETGSGSVAWEAIPIVQIEYHEDGDVAATAE